jgi:glyoxylase-like metal-dependent hydrolase (beta-lactamase superfamily II)
MLESLTVGPIGENTYILAGKGYCILVDPGDEARRIVASLDSYGLVPSLVVATHGHLDHTAAIPEFLATWRSRSIEVPLAAHSADVGYFGPTSEEANRRLFGAIHAISYFENYWRPIPLPDFFLSDGDILPGSPYRVIHSPGHSRGSICLYDPVAAVLVSGDTLFRDGVGRTDAPDSDEAALGTSLRKLLRLPPETLVYPGHGGKTTIGRESGRS